MTIAHNVWKCNKGNTFVAQGMSTDSLPHQANSKTTPQYLSPGYFLASSREGYYRRKYGCSNHKVNLNHQSKYSKIVRIASIVVLSLGLLVTAIAVEASPNFKPVTVTSTPSQQPKKKPILRRVAHKVAKRLGFSSSTSNLNTNASTNPPTAASQHHKQPKITMEELKGLYEAEYEESMEATRSREEDGLAETLKRALALREKTIERRKAGSIFSAEQTIGNDKDFESIYSKPVDSISIASSSSTEYEEPWQEHDDKLGGAFASEFADPKQIEPSAPPLEFSLQRLIEPTAPSLSAFSTVVTDNGLKDTSSNVHSQAKKVIEIGGIKVNIDLLEKAYKDNREREELGSLGRIDREESEWKIPESEQEAELQEKIEELKRRGQYKEPEIIGEYEGKEADARYEKVTAAEEARQTMSRIPSKVSEMKAIMEEKYATIARVHASQPYQQLSHGQDTSADSVNIAVVKEVAAENKEIPVLKEIKEVAAVDKAIEDSGYSSSSCYSGGSRSGTNSPTIDSRVTSPIEIESIEVETMGDYRKDGASDQNIEALNTGKPLDSRVTSPIEIESIEVETMGDYRKDGASDQNIEALNTGKPLDSRVTSPIEIESIEVETMGDYRKDGASDQNIEALNTGKPLDSRITSPIEIESIEVETMGDYRKDGASDQNIEALNTGKPLDSRVTSPIEIESIEVETMGDYRKDGASDQNIEALNTGKPLDSRVTSPIEIESIEVETMGDYRKDGASDQNIEALNTGKPLDSRITSPIEIESIEVETMGDYRKDGASDQNIEALNTGKPLDSRVTSPIEIESIEVETMGDYRKDGASDQNIEALNTGKPLDSRVTSPIEIESIEVETMGDYRKDGASDQNIEALNTGKPLDSRITSPIEIESIEVETMGDYRKDGASDQNIEALNTGKPLDSRVTSPIEIESIEVETMGDYRKDGASDQNIEALNTGKPLDSFGSNKQLPLAEPYSSASSSSYEYDSDEEIRGYENVPIKPRKKRYVKREGSRYSYRDIEQGLANLSDDSEFSESESEKWSDEDSAIETDHYDTVYTSSSSEYPDSGDEYEPAANVGNDYIEDISNISIGEEDLPLPPPPTDEELAELNKAAEVSNPDQTGETPKGSVEVPNQSAHLAGDDGTSEPLTISNSVESEEALQEEREQYSYSNIPAQDAEEENIQALATETDAFTTNSDTSIDKEVLFKKAKAIAKSHNQVREASKVASKQIRHRMFVRDILTAAVAAGDEDREATGNNLGYSIWSSGTLGSGKQKPKANLNGYSSKTLGGSIGADINFENDLLLGASFSKVRSSVKQQNEEALSDLQNGGKNTRTKYDSYIFSLYGSSQVGGNISVAVIGSAGLSKGKKARADINHARFSSQPISKLLSFESHLNYRVELPREVALIPHIGLKYEYEKAGHYKEQITKDHTIERSKKSYQALSGEIGSRVIFAPIKLAGSSSSSFSVTPTAHFSIERRIGSRGKSDPFTITYQGLGQTIGTGVVSTNHPSERTSLNAGAGIIASRKNIKLELLYDQQRQKRFKSHQGVLKLKLSL